MRPIFVGDVLAAARAVAAVEMDERKELCKALFRQAEIADRYTRRVGKPHLDWGRGTLRESAASAPQKGGNSLDEPEFCDCLIVVLEQVRKRPRNSHL